MFCGILEVNIVAINSDSRKTFYSRGCAATLSISMSKRKLSIHQQRRIEKNRETPGSAQASSKKGTTLSDGIVIAHYGKNALIESKFEHKQFRCHIRANLSIATGDRIQWHGDENRAVIENRSPRTSVLERPDNFGKSEQLQQILAKS